MFRAEKEYGSLAQQLQADLEDKREIIKRLSAELDNHARDFADLKTELNKVRGRAPGRALHPYPFCLFVCVCFCLSNMVRM